jgi:hypothetical protein
MDDIEFQVTVSDGSIFYNTEINTPKKDTKSQQRAGSASTGERTTVDIPQPLPSVLNE